MSTELESAMIVRAAKYQRMITNHTIDNAPNYIPLGYRKLMRPISMEVEFWRNPGGSWVLERIHITNAVVLKSGQISEKSDPILTRHHLGHEGVPYTAQSIDRREIPEEILEQAYRQRPTS